MPRPKRRMSAPRPLGVGDSRYSRMPKTASAKKALRQSERRRSQNLKKIRAYKDAVRKFKKLLLAKAAEDAKKQLTAVYKTLDKAVKTNVIHRNKAARLKSRLAKSLVASR